jgi:hypothetical protein
MTGLAYVERTNERRCSDEEAAVVDRPSHELAVRLISSRLDRRLHF